MSATSGTGSESRKLYARVSVMISEKKENYALIASWIRRKVLHWQILFVHVYVVVDLLIALRTPTQRICCLHLQRLAKSRQLLVQLYYP